MKISHFSVNHPAIIGMLMIVLIAFGAFAFFGLNQEFMGDISLPTVEVLAIYPGAGAEDVERDVTNILEQNFVTLPNFKGIDSVSSNTFSWITITFQDDVDPYSMLDEIRNRIRQLSNDLPDTLQGEPVAIVGSATMLPIYMVSVAGGNDMGHLSTYIEDTLVPRLTRIPGVAEVQIAGNNKLEMHVTLRTEDLYARNIPVIQVYQALQYANLRIPIGSADWHGNSVNLRYDGGLTSAEELANLPIGATEDGNILRLSDVATISLTYPEQEVLVDANGEPRLVITVTKRTDGNTLTIVKEIQKVLRQTSQETHDAITFNVLSDDSRNVKDSLSTVARSGLVGMLMAIVVMFLFLSDSRATLTIALSIPLSILFTFIGMRIAGVTINLMSLSGMVVALGIVVDGSIVMLEQIMRIHQRGELSAEEAIKLGADQVGTPILASVTTTVAVFIPLALLSGIIGSILRDVALTLILSLSASLLVALVVVPFILHIVLRVPRKEKRPSYFNRMISALEKRYHQALNWSISARKFILITALIALGIVVIMAGLLGVTFIPSTDNGDFTIDLEFPQGYSLQKSREKALYAQQLVSEAVSEIESIVVFSGQSSGYGFSAPNAANIKVVLVPIKERKRSVHDIIQQVQHLLSESLVDTKVTTANGGFDALVGFVSGGGGYGLKLKGDDMQLLHENAERIRQFLATDPDVLSASIDTSYDSNTLIMDMSHELMSNLGIQSTEAGLTASILFQGLDSGTLVTDSGTRFTIRLESDLAHLPIDSNTLLFAQVPSASGTLISFASLATLRAERAIAPITHSDRQKTVTVSAILVSEDTAKVSQRVQAYLEENPLSPSITSASGGLVELIGDAVGPMVTALLVAIFLVYTVMVIQFERFRQPLIIMASIPFCLIGVVLGLLLFGSSLSLISVMAIIALGGMVVNNGIILIDSINSLREEQEVAPNVDTAMKQLRTCICEGGASRMRPILMTTLTTMLGVVPMAIASGEGSAIYAPLGQAIAGGLLSSTLITLFIIPILYYITERKIIIRSYIQHEAKS
ncbi:MAG: efflux RND transporter permease subunit [Sphaerochaetaceae bacterium]|nr:efflux RND transporter permease subunit [Sphaerochaetaceae bacterium]